MAWLRYNDSWKPSEPDTRAMAVLFVLVCLDGLGCSVYHLWRDWQFHRPPWWDLGDLLVSLCLVVLLCVRVRRARWKSDGKGR